MADDGLNTDGGSQTVLAGSPTSGDAPVEGQNGSTSQPVDGSVQTPKWVEQLPREYRDKFTGYESYKDFVSAADEALGLKDKAIIRPDEDAPAEEWDRFYASVGRPDDPNGYDIEGDGIVANFKEAAHKLGLTTKQAKDLYEWYDTQNKAAEAAKVESAEAVKESLKQEWGDKYNENMKNIERFAKRYGSDELREELSNPLVGNNPNLIKAFALAGAELAPETLVEGKTVSGDKPRGHFEYPWMREMYPPKSI